MIAVEHNGDVYSCDHYVEPDHLLGNVRRGGMRDLLDSDRQREFGRSKRTSLQQQCRRGPVRWACHGGCPKDRFATSIDDEPGLKFLCAGYQHLFVHAEPAVITMAGLLLRGRPAADIMRR